MFFFSSRTIRDHDCNIFANMQRADFLEFRNLIIEMVLHTDMSQHFEQINYMKNMLKQHANSSENNE